MIKEELTIELLCYEQNNKRGESVVQAVQRYKEQFGCDQFIDDYVSRYVDRLGEEMSETGKQYRLTHIEQTKTITKRGKKKRQRVV